MRLFGQSQRQQSHQQPSNHDFAQQAESLIPAEVRMISGCHSEQTSADVSNVSSCTAGGQLPEPAGRSGGACTSALLSFLYENEHNNNNRQHLTFQQVLVGLRKSLENNGFDQIPQLTSSRPLELQETPFSLVGFEYNSSIRRALLVGINYHGQSGELSGCHNDVLNVKKYIIEKQGYLEQDIVILIDDGQHYYPTRETIISNLKRLVTQSVSGDSVYFHYSGLISPDWNNFKMNNKEHDETLYPVDHESSGQIRDFSLFNHFVKPMTEGVMVTCVMDCCHSGSVLDLPYTFQPTSGGLIRSKQNMDSLSNLCFLYILAGGMLPSGFENVTSNIEDMVDGDIDDYQGLGSEDMAINDAYGTDYIPDDDPTDGSNYNNVDVGNYDGADSDSNTNTGDNIVNEDDFGDDVLANADEDGGDYGQSNAVVSGEDVYPSNFESDEYGNTLSQENNFNEDINNFGGDYPSNFENEGYDNTQESDYVGDIDDMDNFDGDGAGCTCIQDILGELIDDMNSSMAFTG